MALPSPASAPSSRRIGEVIGMRSSVPAALWAAEARGNLARIFPCRVIIAVTEQGVRENGDRSHVAHHRRRSSADLGSRAAHRADDALQRCNAERSARAAWAGTDPAIPAAVSEEPRARTGDRTGARGPAVAAHRCGCRNRPLTSGSDQRVGVTAFAPTFVTFHGLGFGIPGGIDIATIFTSPVPALVRRSR